jgi:hypothetical protein
VIKSPVVAVTLMSLWMTGMVVIKDIFWKCENYELNAPNTLLASLGELRIH